MLLSAHSAFAGNNLEDRLMEWRIVICRKRYTRCLAFSLPMFSVAKQLLSDSRGRGDTIPAESSTREKKRKKLVALCI